MRKFVLCLLTAVLLTSVSTILSAQDFSNKGKEFWLCFPSHTPSSNLGQMALFITSDKNSSGTISVGSYSINFSVTANQVSGPFNIPYTEAHLSFNNVNPPLKPNKGIHVQVDAGKPAVVVFAHIYAGFRSQASLILPVATLGRKYYATSFWQNSTANSKSQFQVIATAPNTQVKYRLRKDGVLDPAEQTATLPNAGDVLQIQDDADLTGSVIESVALPGGGCNKIAVFSGSSSLSISSAWCTGTSFDPLFQQCYPVNTWGKEFGVVPLANNPSGFHIRVTASEDNTTVNIDGQNVTLNAGEFYPKSRTAPVYAKPFTISADKPVSVAQFMLSSNCIGAPRPGGASNEQGDPDMIILNPVEQNINDINIFSSNLQVIRSKYLNVFLKTTDAASFKINGVAPTANFIPMPSNNAYSYLTMQLPDNQQSFRLTSDEGFNAITYGMGDAESYGYSAGTNIKDLYQFPSVDNEFASVNFPAACINADFKLSMTFPYEPDEITWQFNGLFPDVTLTNPAYTSTSVVNNRTLYKYTLPDDYNVAAAGTYPIKILAINPTADGCSGTQEIDVELEIYGKPTAPFTITSTGCLESSASFAATANTANRPVTHWYWNLGDNTEVTDVSTLNHTYLAPGTYTIKQTLITDIGCLADTLEKSITIHEKPVANFNVNGAVCIDQPVSFEDLSTVGSGNTITKWSWLSNGSPVTMGNETGSNIYTYKFTQETGFEIGLAVESDKGCKSDTIRKQITVKGLPSIGFILPVACVNDVAAQFTDTSSYEGGSITSWNWNFGDANATAANPNTADIKTPTHHFTVPGEYTVALTATNNDGCSASLQKNISIAGNAIVPAYTITSNAPYCSSNAITLKNEATVDVGKILKIVVYWDYLGDPANVITDNAPETGKLYTYKYPEFGTPASKTYRIRYEAYSGTTCVQVNEQDITILATPMLNFNTVNAICSNEPAFQLTQASQINAADISGTPTFSGNGVSAAGLFSPRNAGAGEHTITYTLLADNGCSNSVQQIITVHPTPVADAGADKFVMEGGQAILTPAIINNIPVTYNWAPVTFLNNPRIAGAIVVKPTEDIVYTLTVTSDKSCTTSDEVKVTLMKNLVIPNIFSPNGDGINDRWEIPYLDTYPGVTIQLFNRYGQQVHQIVNYSSPWDGRINGRDAPIGTYYYIIDPKNGRPPVKGFVDIIR